jgi:hypothetical protein
MECQKLDDDCVSEPSLLCFVGRCKIGNDDFWFSLLKMEEFYGGVPLGEG